ncbi:hypothetical protein PF002_g4257 [Phytophthora fragariae]|uniref:Kinesin motor domain-containing protein n=3 Tax=Phytophthora fragariae TaxID=53985 RepID=A0A6A4A4H7_9STRA|nr:hypothetical protein PF002_g4257 [Phytophthora fragariae]
MAVQGDSTCTSFDDVQSSGAYADVSVPVLSQIHVSCYVTAANRAAPEFEVLPQHNCVRVANKSSSDGASSGGGAVAAESACVVAPAAEWDFHSVFSSTSPSHAIDFFTEITLPALRTARDGINSNIVVWGVHPTQKFRLLFGKNVGGGGFAPQPEMAVNDVVELYGQLVGMLHAFFSRLDLGSRPLEDEPWRLGISSWVIMNNQAIDLLKSPLGGASTEGGRMPSTQAEPFVSLEATSLATAFRIVQTAKTNRIVRKQNAESVHFFVRLAIFHGGQVSTVHLVDLVDQKEFQDPVLNQEKYELYNTLQRLRQPLSSPRQSGCMGGADLMSSTGNMVLSNFMLPLLTANAKTFLYANVIDSRSSLRECVQMLNAVANIRGFASLNREVSNANTIVLRPEVDAVELATTESLLPSVVGSSPSMPFMPTKPDKFTLEAFKKAGLHPCVLEPPNLNGLDSKTAEKVQAADATLLRKNYDALLSIVREQQQAKEAAEARATEALHDQEELRAMFEVQIENMKLANVGLRSKVRALENRTSLPQVFEQYEQELRILHAQVEELQARNVALELRATGDGSVGPSGSLSEIKKKYQQVVEEKLALERELMEHRKRERHHQVHSRLAGESTRRVDQLSRDLNNKEEDLVAARLSKQRLSAEMNQALEKADQLHHENEKLLQEKAVTTEELLATRMYLASLENEKKKASILDRFVEKHGDRMNKLRQHGQSSSGNWRRDQYARECEDKLLASVKRSLPQAVPLCNKLLRRLEIQELSLREFSEREIDFINLLVELVSDQPTVSLKHMIEQEMNKLQSC